MFVQSNMIWRGDRLTWNFNLHVLRNNIANIAGFPNFSRGLNSPPGTAVTYSGPALVLKGDNSNFVQASHYADTVALFPNAQVRSVHGAGHWLHIDRPQDSAQEVAAFIRSVTADAAAASPAASV